MSQTRFGMISQAFDKLDQNYDGCITIDDLRQNYSVECHPKYKSGEMTEDEVLTEFLSSFQTAEAHGDKVTKTQLDQILNQLNCLYSVEGYESKLLDISP